MMQICFSYVLGLDQNETRFCDRKVQEFQVYTEF